MQGFLRTLFVLGALNAPFAVSADSIGTLPKRIVTGEVEQPPLYGPDAPEFRREYQNPEALEGAIEAQERHTDSLLLEAKASATAVGWDANGNPVIKVYASSNTALSEIPVQLDGFNVMIEHSGPFYALNVPCENRTGASCNTPSLESSADPEPSPRQRHPRPVPIGVSVGHVDVTAGTIGCRTFAGCHTYMLSNAHVVANANNGQPGDAVIQPGIYDGGVHPDDLIGTLSYAVPIEMGTAANNRVDAAIISTSAARVGKATPPSGYGVPKTRTASPVIGLNVMKFGRTTAMTYGYIDAINASVLVNYDGVQARFIGQIFMKGNSGDFSQPGDSGSLVVASGGSRERRPVGLIFASGSGITAANPISDVLSQVGTSIDGEY